MHLEEEAPPARHIVVFDPYDACRYAAAAEQPGGEPELDFGREVPDHVAIGGVDPDTGAVIRGGTGDEDEGVAWVQCIEVRGAVAEHSAVNRGAEAGGPIGR
jgi:hypothetical protein